MFCFPVIIAWARALIPWAWALVGTGLATPLSLNGFHALYSAPLGFHHNVTATPI